MTKDQKSGAHPLRLSHCVSFGLSFPIYEVYWCWTQSLRILPGQTTDTVLTSSAAPQLRWGDVLFHTHSQGHELRKPMATRSKKNKSFSQRNGDRNSQHGEF
jgi:hypothetical protein